MDLEVVKQSLSEFLKGRGYSLYSISFSKVKGQYTLALVIDRVKPIDLDAISEISQEVSNFLDEKDLVSEDNYLLDISSLGAEKPLKIEELSLYKDSLVNIHLTNPISGQNIYQGLLVDITEDEITIEYKEKTRVKRVVINKSNIYKIRLAISY
ncbi:MAG: hypothetical protein LUC31_03335 [Coprobacillus sp.]|nr:hypothetical protein [Coprobacillus sp.]